MADLNAFKEKAMSVIGSVADTAKDAAAKTADTAKAMTRIAKLSMDINGDRDTIKKAYAELGKLYYETYKDAPGETFAQTCEEISIAMDGIVDKEQEIANLKASLNEKDSGEIEVEFEEIEPVTDVVGDVVEEAAEPAVAVVAEAVAEPVAEAPAEAAEATQTEE